MSDSMDVRMQQVIGVIKGDIANLTPEQKAVMQRAQQKRNEWVAAYPEIGKNPNLSSILAYGLYRFNGTINGIMEEIFANGNDEIDALLGVGQSMPDKLNLLLLRLTNNILNAERGKTIFVLGKGKKGENKVWNKGTEKESSGHSQFTLTCWVDEKKSIVPLFIADDAIPPYEALEVGKAYKVQMSDGKDGRLFPDKTPLAKPIPDYVLNQKEVLQSVIEGGMYPPLEEPYIGAVNAKKSYYVVGTVSKSPQSGWDIYPRKGTSSQLTMYVNSSMKIGDGDVCLIVGRVIESTDKDGNKIENSYTVFPDVVIPVKKSKVSDTPPLPPAPATPPAAPPKNEIPAAEKDKIDQAFGL